MRATRQCLTIVEVTRVERRRSYLTGIPARRATKDHARIVCAFIQLNSSGQVARFDTMPAMQSELTEQAKKLSISDRINLVEEIWDTIAEENQAFELSDSQKREIDRRLATARSNAGQGAALGRTWEEIKAEFMKSR